MTVFWSEVPIWRNSVSNDCSRRHTEDAVDRPGYFQWKPDSFGRSLLHFVEPGHDGSFRESNLKRAHHQQDDDENQHGHENRW